MQILAKTISDAQIVDQHVPLEMANAIDTDSSPPQKVDREDIERNFIVFDYGSKDGAKILLATYNTKSVPVENPKYRTLAIKVLRNGTSEPIASPEKYKNFGIDDKSALTLADIDGDGVNEIVVTRYDDKMILWESHVLKWTGNTFEDIKFPVRGKESNLLPQLDLQALPLLVYREMIDPGNDLPLISKFQVKQMTSKGLIDFGNFNFVKIVTKDSKKAEEKQYDIKDVSERQYTLEVKNLSKHSRAVRVEISINDVVVLKPTDFCHRKPKLFVKQKDKNNPMPEDDDDDQNEDQCKRCDPSKDIYANVNLKSNDNALKAKLYGNKNSKIQITLKKKI